MSKTRLWAAGYDYAVYMYHFVVEVMNIDSVLSVFQTCAVLLGDIPDKLVLALPSLLDGLLRTISYTTDPLREGRYAL